MADGQIQLPADSAGKALKSTTQPPPAGVAGGSDGFVHEQIIAVGDPVNDLQQYVNDRGDALVNDREAIVILRLIAAELRAIRLILATSSTENPDVAELLEELIV